MIEKSGTGGTTLLMYDEAGHLLGEYTSGGALVQETVWMGDVPIATLRPNGSSISTYYIHTDQLNAPRVITQPSGNAIAWRWDTDPFGTVAPNQNPASLGTFISNPRFPGQYYMAETGLFYNYFRDYDPQTGRYVESDPIGLYGGSYSTYVYVGNGPLQWTDPLGLADWNFFNPLTDPQLYQLAQQWNPSNVYSIAGHGAEDEDLNSLNEMVLPNGNLLTPQQLAQMIQKDPKWKAKPVEIRGCGLGQGRNSFAQQLANLLKVNVTAGTRTEAWNYFQVPFNFGVMSMGIGFPLGGQTKVFGPQN
jgi:RHS repeat-associated protein